MKKPFLEVKQTEAGWQAIFAFQVFHRSGDEWMQMRWGFNAGVLLEEALDRARLFVESQTVPEAYFRLGVPLTRALAIRGINLPGSGLQMGLLGRVTASSHGEAKQNALNYARELYSIFPHDFIVVPAETPDDYQRLSGQNMLDRQPHIARIQRGDVIIPAISEYHFVTGLWQSSHRSNEQIWRALSNMPQQALFNVMLQPSYFYEREKLLEIKDLISKADQSSEPTAASLRWIGSIIERRLALWKRFFTLQVHVMADGELDENLLRSVGSALTRDTEKQFLPGFQTVWPDSDDTKRSWCENIFSMDFTPSSRLNDLADSDEAFAVFRFPYRLEVGLPGANFIAYRKESSSPRVEKG